MQRYGIKNCLLNGQILHLEPSSDYLIPKLILNVMFWTCSNYGQCNNMAVHDKARYSYNDDAHPRPKV
jgi:hypothetical protein